MEIERILLKIQNFKVDETIDEYEISDYFDKIREDLIDVELLTESQKEELIDCLFEFLKSQSPDMDENFSFIHFIESIDYPKLKTYYKKLLEFNAENGTITSTLLLNRYANTLEGTEWKKCVELIKSISENKNYTEYVREFAQDFHEYQMEK